jgi:hypothetical protein
VNLAKINRGRLEALDELARAWSGVEARCSDELFPAALRTFFEIEAGVGEKLVGGEVDRPLDQATRSRLEEYGLRVRESEAGNHLVDDGTWLLRRLGGSLSPAWREYIERSGAERREGFSEDAALLIDWEALRKRIAAWEGFETRYPRFALHDDICERLDLYVRVFLTGMDNSRIDDRGIVRGEVRRAWTRFLREQSESRYHAALKRYEQALRRRRYRLNPEADAVLAKAHLGTMLGVQPPDE